MAKILTGQPATLIKVIVPPRSMTSILPDTEPERPILGLEGQADTVFLAGAAPTVPALGGASVWHPLSKTDAAIKNAAGLVTIRESS